MPPIPRAARTLGGALMLASLALLACGEGAGPTDPTPGRSQSLGLHEDALAVSPENVVMFLSPPDLTEQRSAGKLIRAARGGSVELKGFRVQIPPRALARDTYVTIKLPTTLPEANFVVADFGPSGTRFRKPVRITLPLERANLEGIDLDTVKVSYWDGEAWHNYGGTATSSSVQSSTQHFSTYGARTYRGGIDTTSGG